MQIGLFSGACPQIENVFGGYTQKFQILLNIQFRNHQDFQANDPKRESFELDH